MLVVERIVVDVVAKYEIDVGEEIVKRVLDLAPGDTVVMTGGNTSGQSGNTNVIRIETVV